MTQVESKEDFRPRGGTLTVLLVGSLALLLAVIGPTPKGWLGLAFSSLREIPAPLFVLGLLGLGFMAFFVIAFRVLRRNLAPWTLTLPSGLIGALFAILGWKWLISPFTNDPDRSFGLRAKYMFRGFEDAKNLWSLGFAVSSLLLAFACLMLGLRVRKQTKPVKHRAIAIVASASVFLAVPAIIVLFRLHTSWRAETWIAAIPAGIGMIGILFATPAQQKDEDNPDMQTFAVALLAVGGVVFAAMSVGLACSSFDADDVSLSPGLLSSDFWEKMRVSLLFMLPVMATSLIGGIKVKVSQFRHLKPASWLGASLVMAPLVLTCIPLSTTASEVGWLRKSQQQITGSPGVPVVDTSLPSGTLVVDLVSPVDSITPLDPAEIAIQGVRGPWSPGRPTYFEGLLQEDYVVHVLGPYLWERKSVRLPQKYAGARMVIQVLPLYPPLPRFVSSDVTPEKILEVDMTQLQHFTLRWVQGATIVTTRDLPRVPVLLDDDVVNRHIAYPSLAAQVYTEWQYNGSHKDFSDRRFDTAIVRAAPATPLEEARAVAEAILNTKRLCRTPEGSKSMPAFIVVFEQPPHL